MLLEAALRMEARLSGSVTEFEVVLASAEATPGGEERLETSELAWAMRDRSRNGSPSFAERQAANCSRSSDNASVDAAILQAGRTRGTRELRPFRGLEAI